jgi:hypothetical protein
LNRASPIDFCYLRETRARPRTRNPHTYTNAFTSFRCRIAENHVGCERSDTGAPVACLAPWWPRLAPRRRLPYRPEAPSQRCVLRRKRPTRSPPEHLVVVNRSCAWARRLDAHLPFRSTRGSPERRPRERGRRLKEPRCLRAAVNPPRGANPGGPGAPICIPFGRGR